MELYQWNIRGKIEGESSGDCAGKGHFLECHNELIFSYRHDLDYMGTTYAHGRTAVNGVDGCGVQSINMQ